MLLYCSCCSLAAPALPLGQKKQQQRHHQQQQQPSLEARLNGALPDPSAFRYRRPAYGSPEEAAAAAAAARGGGSGAVEQPAAAVGGDLMVE